MLVLLLGWLLNMTILLIASLTMFTFFTYCAVVAYYQMFKEDFGDL